MRAGLLTTEGFQIISHNTFQFFKRRGAATSGISASHSLLRSRTPTIIQKTFVRRILGPPPGTNWSGQWHEILHEWNMRVDYWVHASGISSWSKRCVTQYWTFASYNANLPAERWVRRALTWQPLPTHPSRGRPQQTWDTKLEMFCRYKTLGNWEIVARTLRPCFLDYCSM